MLYPQVNAVRHPLRLGLAEVVQTGLDQTDGEILFVGDEHSGIDPDDLRKLWPLRSQRGLVLARPPATATASTPWIEKLLAWTPRRGQPASGVQMIRRREFEALRRSATPRPGQNRRVDSALSSASGDLPPRPIYLQNKRHRQKNGGNAADGRRPA